MHFQLGVMFCRLKNILCIYRTCTFFYIIENIVISYSCIVDLLYLLLSQVIIFIVNPIYGLVHDVLFECMPFTHFVSGSSFGNGA